MSRHYTGLMGGGYKTPPDMRELYDFVSEFAAGEDECDHDYKSMTASGVVRLDCEKCGHVILCNEKLANRMVQG